MKSIQTILVPVDFSRHSSRALEHVIDFAKTFGAKIHLLHVYILPMGLVTPYNYQLPASILTEARDAVVRKLDEQRQKVEAEGIKVEAHVTEGLPSAAIRETAESIGADLIVMGTRGLTGLKHVILGSVAERTLREAPCPVLTVHDRDA